MQSTTPLAAPIVPGAPTLNSLYSPTIPEATTPGPTHGVLHIQMPPGMSPPSYPPTPYPPTPAAGSVRGGTSHSDLRARAHMSALSASFTAMADQLAAASKVLTSTNGTAAGAALDPHAVLAALNELSARLTRVEKAQSTLSDDLDDLRREMERASGTQSSVGEIQEEATSAAYPAEKRTMGPGMSDADVDSVMERVTAELESRLAELMEHFRLEQSRLYARLHNASCVQQKMQIKPLPMKNGKTPANFPNTKGEFEHLTKERYEYMLKSYEQPVQGDTAAKREACRVFLGLPPRN